MEDKSEVSDHQEKKKRRKRATGRVRELPLKLSVNLKAIESINKPAVEVKNESR